MKPTVNMPIKFLTQVLLVWVEADYSLRYEWKASGSWRHLSQISPTGSDCHSLLRYEWKLTTEMEAIQEEVNRPFRIFGCHDTKDLGNSRRSLSQTWLRSGRWWALNYDVQMVLMGILITKIIGCAQILEKTLVLEIRRMLTTGLGAL
jgi:hypothetical protein